MEDFTLKQKNQLIGALDSVVSALSTQIINCETGGQRTQLRAVRKEHLELQDQVMLLKTKKEK